MATWIVLSGALAAPSLSTIPATYSTGGDDDDDHDGGNGGDDDGKVTLCHIPPSNPENVTNFTEKIASNQTSNQTGNQS